MLQYSNRTLCISLQTHHVDSTLNPRGVFVGMILQFMLFPIM